jgi:hypothetical protein
MTTSQALSQLRSLFFGMGKMAYWQAFSMGVKMGPIFKGAINGF